MDAPSDLDLLNGCIAGDRQAWSGLVERFTRYVYYFIRLTAKRHHTEFGPEEMADLHNDLFVALFEDDCRRLRAYRGDNGCSVRSWIRIITIRRCLDALRRRRVQVSIDVEPDEPGPRAPTLVSDEPDPLEALLARDRAERRAQLDALTEGLSERDRLLLEMIYVRKMSADAIAATLRIKKGALYTRKTRLIKRLNALAVEAGLAEVRSG